ncbi:MAG: tetratricopeptide repeat protein [Candidatus Latescibacteria bacterium]|nr:tetratricopeptide repeat protein [Candidatus Latescibacterota bacterium]
MCHAAPIKIIRRLVRVLLLILPLACQPQQEATAPAPWSVRLVDETTTSGLRFTQVSGSEQQRFILESVSSGAAFFDYDGDRDLDLFLVNSTRLEGDDGGATNQLYRNLGQGQFEDVTQSAGLEKNGWGMGTGIGDYDNDGTPDLYLTYWGPNILYHNQGDGTFTPARAGVADDRWGTSAAFGDINGDGLLDLFVANYLLFDPDDPPGDGLPCNGWKGLEVYCGPHGMESQANILYRNDGYGTFTDISTATQIDRIKRPSLGVVMADFDDDGDQDIYVANDGFANELWRNDGSGLWTETGAASGTAFSEDGRPQAGMGVAAGDYDNDGDTDLYVTHFSDDVNTLYQNRGKGTFVDHTAQAGLSGIVRPYLGWGAAFIDFDNDGWLDLFAANGHIYPQVDQHPSGPRYAQPNLLYRNRGGHFVEVGSQTGPGLTAVQVSRGTAVGDYDNDGDTDLVVVNLNGPPTLLRNQGTSTNNWLGLELVGRPSNRDALGARVRLWAGDLVVNRQVRRAHGYLSQHDKRLLFGLGAVSAVEKVEIRWPSGHIQYLMDPPLRRYLVVEEGSDSVAAYTAPNQPTPPPVAAPPPQGQGARLPAPDLTPFKGPGLYQRGLELHRQSRHQESLHFLRAALTAQPEDKGISYTLAGVLYSGLGRSAEAAALLEKSLVANPDHAPLHLLLGEIYLDLDQAERAGQTLRQGLELAPSNWEARHRLGLALARQDSLQQALAAFAQASAQAPWQPNPHLQAALLHRRLGNEEAAQQAQTQFNLLEPTAQRVQTYRKVLDESPHHQQVRYLLACTYFEQGHTTASRTCFQDLIDADSTYAPAFYGMAALVHQEGDLERAIGLYERAYNLDTSQVEILGDLGQAYYQKGRYAHAVGAFRLLLEQHPDWVAPWVKLGLTYVAQQRLGEAGQAFRHALAADSTSFAARDGLGRVYATQGRYDQAIAHWQAALKLQPGNTQIPLLIHMAQEELAHPDG